MSAFVRGVLELCQIDEQRDQNSAILLRPILSDSRPPWFAERIKWDHLKAVGEFVGLLMWLPIIACEPVQGKDAFPDGSEEDRVNVRCAMYRSCIGPMKYYEVI